MLTPNLMPGSVCITDGTPTALTPAVSLETWMEFYWKVRAFNVTGSGVFSVDYGDDDIVTFFDTFNGVQGNSIPGVLMLSFMCQFYAPGLPESSFGPNPQAQSGVFGTYSDSEGGGGTFEASLRAKRGFKNSGNYYIDILFGSDSVSTYLGGSPAGQINFILESGSFVMPLFHDDTILSASYSLTATPASFNIPD